VKGEPKDQLLILDSVGNRESLVALLCRPERVRFQDKTMFAPQCSQASAHSVNGLLE
jgi:hypothetical protein